jgi:hypothetical protein
MAGMSGYLKELEAHDDLEAEVIKKTKVHKVLKAIIKLNSIPKEEEYSFKQRSSELLTKWGGALAADAEPAAGTSAEPATNGVKHDEKEKSEPTKEEPPVQKNGDAPAEKKDDTPTDLASATKAVDLNGDATMADADKELNKDEPAVKADAESSVEASVEAAAGIDTAPTSIDATMS